MFIKNKEFPPTYLYLVGNFLVLCRASSAVRNIPTFLILDFPQLLDILGNRLKYHINIVQGFKKTKWVFRFLILLSHRYIRFFVLPIQVYVVLNVIIVQYKFMLS